MRLGGLFFTLLFLWAGSLCGQAGLQFGNSVLNVPGLNAGKFPLSQEYQPTGQKLYSPLKNNHLLPESVRKNPAGHSFLCRMEVRIEKRLPIGVWMKISEDKGLEYRPHQLAHMRFKLLNF